MRSTTSFGAMTSPSARASTLRVVNSGVGEYPREQRLGLVDAAQSRVAPGENLHRHDRVEILVGEDFLGAMEIDVGRIG